MERFPILQKYIQKGRAILRFFVRLTMIKYHKNSIGKI